MKTPVHRSASPTRRRILQAGATFTAAAPFLSTRAYAAWPDRPIRLVVPFGSGGPVDVVTRLLQPALSEELKASMFIENKPGAAGNIGVGHCRPRRARRQYGADHVQHDRHQSAAL